MEAKGTLASAQAQAKQEFTSAQAQAKQELASAQAQATQGVGSVQGRLSGLFSGGSSQRGGTTTPAEARVIALKHPAVSALMGELDLSIRRIDALIAKAKEHGSSADEKNAQIDEVVEASKKQVGLEKKLAGTIKGIVDSEKSVKFAGVGEHRDAALEKLQTTVRTTVSDNLEDRQRAVSAAAETVQEQSKGLLGMVTKIFSGGRRKKKSGHPKKGQKSKTRKGRLDFVTHKGDKYYNRKGHRQTRNRKGKKGKPYGSRKRKAGTKKKHKKSRHPKKGQKSKTRKDRLDFVTHKGDKYYNRDGHRQRYNRAGVYGKPYQMDDLFM